MQERLTNQSPNTSSINPDIKEISSKFVDEVFNKQAKELVEIEDMNLIQKDNREIEGMEGIEIREGEGEEAVAVAKLEEKEEVAVKVEENFDNKPEEGNVKGSFGTGYDKDSWNKDQVNKDDNKEVVEE